MTPFSAMTLAGIVGNRASVSPVLPALTAEGGGVRRDETRTYAELWQCGQRLALGLQRLGVKPGDRFAVLMANHAQFIDIEADPASIHTQRAR